MVHQRYMIWCMISVKSLKRCTLFRGARFFVAHTCTNSLNNAHEKPCTRIPNSFSSDSLILLTSKSHVPTFDAVEKRSLVLGRRVFLPEWRTDPACHYISIESRESGQFLSIVVHLPNTIPPKLYSKLTIKT